MMSKNRIRLLIFILLRGLTDAIAALISLFNNHSQRVILLSKIYNHHFTSSMGYSVK